MKVDIQKVGIFCQILVFLLFFNSSFSQVGIGTTNPDTNAVLDITSTATAPGGLLLPRVQLIATNNAAPLTAPVEPGMTVYNLASVNDVTPGYYYHNGTVWVRIAANSDSSDDWKTTGNAGTSVASNFIGTTDNVSFQIRTNGNERIRVLANGQIAVNRPTAISNTRLTIEEIGANRAIYGNSVTGEGVRGESNGGDGVIGLATTGRGVYGQATSGPGVSGRSTVANAQGGFFLNSLQNGVGLTALGGGGLSYSFTNSGTGAAITGRLFGSTSISSIDNGIGVVGIGDNLGGLPVRPLGIGVLGFGFETGVFGDSGYFSQIGVHGRAEGIGTFAGVGVLGENISGPGYGVVGESSNIGVYGTAAYGGIFESGINNGYTIIRNTSESGANRIGLVVAGQNLGLTAFAGTGAVLTGFLRGGAGFANSPSGTGLVGVGNNLNVAGLAANGSGVAGTGSNLGVFGKADQITNGIGVIGLGNNGSTYITPNVGAGVAGTGVAVGIYGHATDESGFGVYSSGDLHTEGNITASGNLTVTGDLAASGTKNFIIDDPRDPSNKYLKHASIESNEILNLYRGMSTFNALGEVDVQLPDYYEAINKNASYQLTPIGSPMPNLYIAAEVQNGVFIIAGGVPLKMVSWTITAERNDPYVRNNPEIRNMSVEKGVYRGRYLMPEAYGQPPEKGILSSKEGMSKGKLDHLIVKQVVVAQEVQSENEEAAKLTLEQRNDSTTPIKSNRTKNSGEKKLRNTTILKAQQTEAALETIETETQKTKDTDVKS